MQPPPVSLGRGLLQDFDLTINAQDLRQEIKPHKVRYYLENRDAEFEQKVSR